MRQESGELSVAESEKPLSPRQRAFAMELGVAIARGDRNYAAAYGAAGFAPHIGNAARLAADPRVKAIAEEICAEQLRLAGLHVGYLQAKALELLHANAFKIHQLLRSARSKELTEDEAEALESATWALSEFKIDKNGVITVKLPDKKGIIEMLAKQLGVGKEDNSVNVGVSLEALVNQSIQREAAE